jgi:serine phosphatase RsbU (regulator of sigma subunit)
VTGKGVPAALVMATTQSILRGEAPRHASPGAVLAHTNERLVKEIPAQMHVTCLYAILTPATGRLEAANAGHNYPCIRSEHGVNELRARGMPLGLLSGMIYEEVVATMAPGARLGLYTDGLVEARNAKGELFGFPRLLQVFGNTSIAGIAAMEMLVREVAQFVGDSAEQEDDMTLVILHRAVSLG